MEYKFDDFKHDYSKEEDYIDQEDELAFMYSLTTAFGGNVESMKVLGDCYSRSGYGVKKDCKKAAFWYEKAVEHGDMYSAFCLAELYYNGNGVAQDKKKALSLYKFAAEKGSVGAKEALKTYFNID